MRKLSKTKVALLVLVGPLTVALIGLGSYYYYSDLPSSQQNQVASVVYSTPTEEDDYEFTDDEVALLTNKLSVPRPFSYNTAASNTEGQVPTQQFLHLHHMKTGGTSMDAVLRCAHGRLESSAHNGDKKKLKIPYGNIHECGLQHYINCKTMQDPTCNDRVRDAAILSYCAPLKDLPAFSWNESPRGAITVLRHPVERVWSMFRFQTKMCYQCTPLLDIYKAIDNGSINVTQASHHEMGTQYRQGCIDQLQNHETANLLSTEWEDRTLKKDDTDTERVQEAIANMKSFFTIVGLTEELNVTVQMVGHVFPWMQERVGWSSKTCSLPHANQSPKNNGCGADRSHWELPSHPDEETRKAIEAHNQLDLRLYEAAKRHFALQKLATGLQEAN
jgi:hypothetical protein